MAKYNIAMLSVGNPKQATDTVVTDADMLEMSNESFGIEAIDSIIQETRTAAKAVKNMANSLRATPIVSNDAIKIAQEMMGYFCERTGIKSSGVKLAMESFQTGGAANKDKIVKELRLASENYQKQIAIAQEGIVDRIKYKFSLVFSNYDKLKRELAEASGRFDEKGAQEETIDNPAFARIFYVPGRSVITGSEVIALASKVAKGVGSHNLITTVEKITRIVDGLTLAVSKGGLFSDKQSISEIEDLYKELEELSSNVYSEFNLDINKKNISVSPIKQEEKDKLEKLVVELLDTGDFKSAEAGLYRAVDAFSNAYLSAKERRLFDNYSADLNIAAEVEYQAYATYGILSKLVSYGFDVAHASVKYIKASTNA